MDAAFAPGPEGWRVDEPRAVRWGRRALTIPGVWIAAAVVWALLPVAMPLALAADAAGRRLRASRALALLACLLACETLGLLASLAVWLAAPVLSRSRWERIHHRLQWAWAAALLGSARRIYSLELRLAGDAPDPARPVVVFVRHASTVDVLVPAVLVSGRHGTRLRYVMKRELLWDPCLDVVGQRLPNVFVRRGSPDPEREVATIRALCAGLGPGEGAVVFPEGTRFTEAKRERALARVEAGGDAERLARVRRLRHVLPPRSGGPLAVLDAVPGADVFFLGHAGLEGIRSLREALAGGLAGRIVAVRGWLCPAESVPDGAAKRLEWLDAWWARLDAWIGETRAESRADRGPRATAGRASPGP